MKISNHILAVGLLVGLVTHPVWAGEQDFSLTNKTGDPLEELYISPSNSEDWEEDVLGQDVLEDGESATIRFNRKRKSCEWDIKVVYPDGDEPVWYGIDLCEVESVTLYWDDDNEQTYATIH